jgi:phospholipase C
MQGMMRHNRKTRATGLAFTICVCFAALTGNSTALLPPVTAGGAMQCTMTGKVRFSPALTAVPQPTTMRLRATLSCPPDGAGIPNVTLTSSKIVAIDSLTSASCVDTDLPSGQAQIRWRATRPARVVPSLLDWSSVTVTDGSSTALDLDGAGLSGSYAGATTHVHIVSDPLVGGRCDRPNRRGFDFSGAGGQSTLTFATPNPNGLPIDHIVVLMQENHSADDYLSQLGVQGQPDYEPEPTTGNPNPQNPAGPPIVPFHKTNYCEVADLNHSWNGTHAEIDGGAMDGFTAANVSALDPTGSRAMGYYDQTDLPFYYGLHNTFATADRYFASAPTQTYPNRLYLFAGTSFGHIRNDASNLPGRSIFNLLDEKSITWRIYSSQGAYADLFFSYVQAEASTHIFPIAQYYTDLANGELPDVAFVDPKLVGTPTVANDEHPPADVQVGQKFVADIVDALMNSSEWASSALFLTYDEHGGYYDHVVPPAAPIPDDIPPMLQPHDTPGAFDQYGPRVPAVVVSPYSKPHFVSHVVHDHTSILRFIEYRYGLPALTNRDANADPMLEMFDFSNPQLASPPSLPQATIDQAQLAAC